MRGLLRPFSGLPSLVSLLMWFFLIRGTERGYDPIAPNYARLTDMGQASHETAQFYVVLGGLGAERGLPPVLPSSSGQAATFRPDPVFTP